MRRRKSVEEEIDDEEVGEELSEKEQKKKKQKEGADKRKNAKKKDKVARWGGLILLGLIMFVGFLLYVSGEMKQENIPLNQRSITPDSTVGRPIQGQSGSVIVK